MDLFSVSLKPMSFEEVYSQSSPTNCTVYCGGILTALTGKNFSVVYGKPVTVTELGRQNIQVWFIVPNIMVT